MCKTMEIALKNIVLEHREDTAKETQNESAGNSDPFIDEHNGKFTEYVLLCPEEELKYFPQAYKRIVEKLHKCHKKSREGQLVTKQEMLSCAYAYRQFLYWYVAASNMIHSLGTDEMSQVLKMINRLNFIQPSGVKSDNRIKNEVQKLGNKENSDEDMAQIKAALLDLSQKQNAMLEDVQAIKVNTDTILEKIDSLFDKISDYQGLVQRQIEMAGTNQEEIEHIIAAFSEECISKISAELIQNQAKDEMLREEANFKAKFGPGTWNQLSEDSKNFLITARLLLSKLAELEEDLDHSSICLLVCKALELECSKRFYGGYRKYLSETLPFEGNEDAYPISLVEYDSDGNKILKKPTKLTLGSFSYVTCQMFPKNTPSDRQKADKACLDGYLKTVLTKEAYDNRDELIHDFSAKIMSVKDRFRNPSAHTKTLHFMEAKECFDIVVDIEKLLIRILDSFDENK